MNLFKPTILQVSLALLNFYSSRGMNCFAYFLNQSDEPEIVETEFLHEIQMYLMLGEFYVGVIGKEGKKIFISFEMTDDGGIYIAPTTIHFRKKMDDNSSFDIRSGYEHS